MLYKRSLRWHLKPCAGGLCAIRCRLSMPHQRRRELILVNRLRPDDWDPHAQRPKPRRAHSVAQEQNAITAALDHIFARFELIDQQPPHIAQVIDLLKQALGRRPQTPARPTSLLDALDQYTLQRSSDGAGQATINTLRALRKALSICQPTADLGDLNDSLQQRLANSLTQRGRRNSTVNAYLHALRAFAKWCQQQHTHNLAPLTTLRLDTLRGHNPIHLTPNELRAIRDLTLPEPLHTTRQAFLLCCLTGLRHSDCRALTPANVNSDALHIVTQKTRTALTIHLCHDAQTIVDERLQLRAETLFPPLRATRAIAHLRQICRLARIDQPTSTIALIGKQRHTATLPKWKTIGTHTARRTFVTQALALGIPAEVVMRWTGHANFQAMRPYIAFIDHIGRENMDKFDQLLSHK